MAPRILYDVVLGNNVLRGVENNLAVYVSYVEFTNLWLYDGMTIADNGTRIYLMRVEFYPWAAELERLEIGFVIFAKRQDLVEDLKCIMRRKQ